MTRRFKQNLKNKKTRRRYSGGNPKKLNCSPLVKGKTVNKNSCFTEDVLNVIKKEYNKDHRENQIMSHNKDEIWNELKHRLSTCDGERCWLNEIDNTVLRKKIDKLIFAPDSPPEWKKNPDEWLSNFDILDVLKQYEEAYPNFKFIGPSPIDFDARPSSMNGDCVTKELCQFSLKKMMDNKKTKIGIVFNLDKHNQSGSHWVSLFVDVDNNFLFYFDSAANSIPNEIKTLIDRILTQAKAKQIGIEIKDVTKIKQHQYGNTECGMYSLYFITTLLTEETGEGKKLHTNQEKIDYFTKKRIPDKYVFDYRKKFFNGGDGQGSENQEVDGKLPIPNDNTKTLIMRFEYIPGKSYPVSSQFILEQNPTIENNTNDVNSSLNRLVDYAEYEDRVKRIKKLNLQIQELNKKIAKTTVGEEKNKITKKIEKLKEELNLLPEIKIQEKYVTKTEDHVIIPIKQKQK